MTIGFDASRGFILKRTGTENYSYQLLKALSKIDQKNKYTVYLRSGTKDDPLQGWPKNFQFLNLNFQFLWTQVGLALQTFKDSPDVLFVPAHTIPIIRRPGLKTIMVVHDLGVEYLPELHQLKQQLYLKYITRYQLRSATRLIAVSKATKEDLVKKAKIDPKKISVVYEGYNEKLFKPIKITKHDVLVNSLIPYYLFVGTIQPRKNLERLFKAFESVAKGNLVIVGSKGWLSDKIYKLPKRLGIESRVKFLGYVEDKDLPALYSGAIALTFPSLFEGFGLPILEAQACGCPVLTSNVSSMPEVARKGAIFVDPYSIDDIIRGMRKIMDNDIRMNLIKAGFENIKRFSWEKCARETLEVLKRV